MVEIVNYVKVQCSTYTHYNESSESKSLLHPIQEYHPPRVTADSLSETFGLTAFFSLLPYQYLYSSFWHFRSHEGDFLILKIIKKYMDDPEKYLEVDDLGY